MDPSFHLQKLVQSFKATRTHRGLMVIQREAAVAASIPQVVTAIAHYANMLKEVFFD